MTTTVPGGTTATATATQTSLKLKYYMHTYRNKNTNKSIFHVSWLQSTIYSLCVWYRYCLLFHFVRLVHFLLPGKRSLVLLFLFLVVFVFLGTVFPSPRSNTPFGSAVKCTNWLLELAISTDKRKESIESSKPICTMLLPIALSAVVSGPSTCSSCFLCFRDGKSRRRFQNDRRNTSIHHSPVEHRSWRGPRWRNRSSTWMCRSGHLLHQSSNFANFRPTAERPPAVILCHNLFCFFPLAAIPSPCRTTALWCLSTRTATSVGVHLHRPCRPIAFVCRAGVGLCCSWTDSCLLWRKKYFAVDPPVFLLRGKFVHLFAVGHWDFDHQCGGFWWEWVADFFS